MPVRGALLMLHRRRAGAQAGKKLRCGSKWLSLLLSQIQVLASLPPRCHRGSRAGLIEILHDKCLKSLAFVFGNRTPTPLLLFLSNYSFLSDQLASIPRYLILSKPAPSTFLIELNSIVLVIFQLLTSYSFTSAEEPEPGRIF